MFFMGRTACRAVDSSNRIDRRFYSSLSHLLVVLLILSFFTTYSSNNVNIDLTGQVTLLFQHIEAELFGFANLT
ncbi:hypothetical protein GMJAKD_01845 [Candidatus Electrothrix aarhusensis]